MKKRTLAVLMAGAMAASLMAGVVSVYADAENKTLTVGFDAEYPPFGYKDDNGEYVGFDLDLAQEVCDNLGWELVRLEATDEIKEDIQNALKQFAAVPEPALEEKDVDSTLAKLTAGYHRSTGS